VLTMDDDRVIKEALRWRASLPMDPPAAKEPPASHHLRARLAPLAAGLGALTVCGILLALLWPLARGDDQGAAGTSPLTFTVNATWEVPGAPVAVLPDGDSVLVATVGELASTTIYRVRGSTEPEVVMTSQSAVVDMAATPTQIWMSTFKPGGEPELIAVDPATFEPSLVIADLANPIAADAGHVYASALSGGGTRVVSLDAETGRELAHYESPNRVMNLLTNEGLVYLMPLEGTLIRVLDDELKPLGTISPEGDWAASGLGSSTNSFTVLIRRGSDAYLEHFTDLGVQPGWTVPSEGGPIGTTSQAVVTSNGIGDIIALDLLTGDTLATISLSSGVGGGSVFPTAAVEGDSVWVAGHKGEVTQLTLGTSQVRSEVRS